MEQHLVTQGHASKVEEMEMEMEMEEDLVVVHCDACKCNIDDKKAFLKHVQSVSHAKAVEQSLEKVEQPMNQSRTLSRYCRKRVKSKALSKQSVFYGTPEVEQEEESPTPEKRKISKKTKPQQSDEAEPSQSNKLWVEQEAAGGELARHSVTSLQ